ncbi:hypothetical protein DFR50_14067 [Roseiarcus fermentans]|uniref:Uncharacterized protein n=1 Tax=Roseiarcus fermentans TaxID=1473586 RepID=A0A366EPH4_9HYPH|nr:hypothetical protein [Roseiarcus fermentans]RBP04194.1 hypothetical protein DFR50_14067 [Roseiarcus fermentans]
MSKVAILRSFVEVSNRLVELRTNHEFILEAVEAAVGAANESTDNDPSGTRGWRRWQMGTRRLREMHVGNKGWDRDDTDQIASIINADLRIKIVVCNTDDGTCIEARNPKNRSKKGSATDRAVGANQSSFMDILDESMADMWRRRQPDGSFLTYVLCIYNEADDVRAELSCAIETSGGFFENFSERIFIIGGEAGEPSPVRRRGSDDDGSEFDIPVTRKK